MWLKLAEYPLIAVLSFAFFTIIFHTVANAQTSPQPQTQKPISIAEDKRLLLSPTPTIYFLPTTPPKIAQPSPTNKVTTTDPSITPSKEEKAKQSVTPVPTSKLTIAPTVAVPTPTTVPTTQQAVSGGLSADKLFSLVNAHRQAKGLQPLQRDDRTCQLASARASEIAGEMAAGNLHSGMYSRNLPYWNTENASALPSEEAALNWWLNDGIHRQAIESSSHTTSCVACSGIYCAQEFTSYQSK